MSSRALVKFATGRDLFEAFPTAEVESGLEASDEPSLDFLRRHAAAGNFSAAISLCAYLLSRREAVWWACSCLRQVEPRTAGEARCLEAAEAWVRMPEEEQRRAALDAGTGSSTKSPLTWVALAAGWSGGNLSASDAHRVQPAPQMTAQAVRCAVLMAPGRLPAARAEAVKKGWIEAALRLLIGDLAAG